MRASRLLQLLLILQNRGQQTSAQLAAELEVSTRTILRDIDALQEAGLPVIVHQGNRGGIELGFDYRTRLTGLTRTEAEALGVIMASPNPMVTTLGLEKHARRALSKIFESLPDSVKTTVTQSRQRIVCDQQQNPGEEHPVITAITRAIAGAQVVTAKQADDTVRVIHPTGITQTTHGWLIQDAIDPDLPVNVADLVSINISAHTF